MPLSERLSPIQERGVPVSCPDSVKQVVWIPWHIFSHRPHATNMFLIYIIYIKSLKLELFPLEVKSSAVSQCTILKCPVSPSWVNMLPTWPFVVCCFMVLHDLETNHYCQFQDVTIINRQCTVHTVHKSTDFSYLGAKNC